VNDRQAKTLPKLQSDWTLSRNTAGGWPQFLEAVQVDGLRGWQDQWIEFRFPVVAIAGENGSGKSTILKAAAAAYGPTPASKDYSPDDFFPTTPWEDVRGVRLGYRIRRGNAVTSHSVRKQTTRWRGMPERPARATQFLDISRTQPIDTLIGYGRIARTELARDSAPIELSDEYRGRLSRILGRDYDSGALVRDQRGKQVGVVVHGGHTYSNFHQGAGEDAMTDLMVLLEEAPRHSLVLIDEVEASLHPRAQRRLMTELIAIATDRRLQLVVTTHSEYVLEQLPAEARLYLRVARDGQREPIYGVTPRYALGLMDDERHPELTLYCEDGRAGTIAEGLIRLERPELLRRMQITPVGPAGTVRLLGALSQARKLPELGLGVLDADQGPAEGCILLPGAALAPEKAVIGAMPDADVETVAERLGVRAGTLLDAKEDSLRLDEHHSWPQRIAERLSGTMRESRVWDAFVDVWIRDVLTADERRLFVEEVADALPVIEAVGD
jgi:predicted ATPase